MFQRKHKPRATVQRQAQSSSDEESAEGGGAAASSSGPPPGESDEKKKVSLRDLKFLQQQRRARSGVGTMPTFQDPVKAKEEEDSDEDVGGLMEMHDRFGTSGSSGKEKTVDPHLEAYLKERIEELNVDTPAGSLEKEAEDAERKRNEQIEAAAEIYNIPEELRPTNHMVQHSEEMSWMAGLLEVDTGVESQLRNIEATEQEKKKWLESLAEQREKEAEFRRDRAVNKAFGNRFRAYQMRSDGAKGSKRGKGGGKGGGGKGGGGGKSGSRPY